jgi:transposase-like protein
MSTHKVEKTKSQVKLIFGGGAEGEFDLERLMEELGLEFHAFAASAGVLVMQGLMALEEKHLVGERHSRGHEVYRWTKERGSLMVGGQRVAIDRQRYRTKDNREKRLETYDRFHENGDRSHAVYERLLGGLSCRDYERTVEAVADGYGVSKSVVNREMIKATAADLASMNERSLATFDLRVLLLDGLRVGKFMVTAALGVDSQGKKQFLGFREGSTESSRVCLDLLNDLRRRGLRCDQPLIVVIDGSPALRSAVDEFFGAYAEVARCQQHKIANVKKYLPKEYHSEYDRKLRAAWGMREYVDAKRALAGVMRDLQRINSKASDSLGEGFEETLTLHRLAIPGVLRVSFSTTNAIESPFSFARKVTRNVKRWRSDTNQSQRWIASALIQVEKRFRKVRGYKSMSVLVAAVEEAYAKKQQSARQNVA